MAVVNRSCLVPARGNMRLGVMPRIEKDDVCCEFIIVSNERVTFCAQLEVERVEEVVEILRAFLAAPVRQE